MERDREPEGVWVELYSGPFVSDRTLPRVVPTFQCGLYAAVQPS